MTDDEQQLLQIAKDRLEHDGWSVWLESFDRGFIIRFDHQLTTARGLSFDRRGRLGQTNSGSESSAAWPRCTLTSFAGTNPPTV